MTKPMTHLDAFCSPDAKRGLVWTDGKNEYRRSQLGALLMRSPGCHSFRFIAIQVAAMEGPVYWADEPKTLTPQEALRALADGKCVACKSSGRVFRMTFGGFQYWRLDEKRWSDTGISGRLSGFVVPDPSQPADCVHAGEPITKVRDDMRDNSCGPIGLWHSHTEFDSAGNVTYPPSAARPAKSPLKVGDRVRRAPGCECHLEEGDSPCRVHGEDEEAEPQVSTCEKCGVK